MALASTLPPVGLKGDSELYMTDRGLLRTNADPASSLIAVTPSDTTVYNPPLRGLYVGGTGNVAVVAASDTSSVTLNTVPAGTFVPVIASKVLATGTTATNIVGYY